MHIVCTVSLYYMEPQAAVAAWLGKEEPTIAKQALKEAAEQSFAPPHTSKQFFHLAHALLQYGSGDFEQLAWNSISKQLWSTN